MASPDISRWSLWQLVTALHDRDISSPEIVESLLATISRLEPSVRAFVTVTDDLARQQAIQAQYRLDEGGAAVQACTGVPVVVKDLLDVRGLATTAGSRVLADNIAESDSALWSSLRAQGAVHLGKTNTHEFAYGGATEPTRNPWDLSKVPGGSSGGSAAALAAGMCHAAFGTDTAGSVRIPAALCGVTGLKPTNGTFSTNGVVPLSHTLDVIGPMAKTPRDVHLIFEALRRGASPGDVQRAVGNYAHARAGLRVGVVTCQGDVSAPVRKSLERAAGALRDAGAHVSDVELAMRLDDAAAVNFTIMGAEAAAIHRQWLDARPEDYSAAVRDRIREAASISARDYIDALGRRTEFRHHVDVALSQFDVLLLNGLPSVATPAYDDEIELEGSKQNRDWIMCRDMAFANVTGHPVLQVPAGCADGLPVGVQLLARHGKDDALFAPGDAIFEQLAEEIPQM